MTTTKHETEIQVDPDVPLVRIIREFDAPAAKVFRAHVDPELAARWMGPKDRCNVIDEWDARSGGAYRYRCGDQPFYGSFHEIRPDSLIVQTFCWAGQPDGIALEKLSFEDLDGGRCRLTATSLVDSFADRDAFVSGGMEAGVIEGYESLDEVLAAGQG